MLSQDVDWPRLLDIIRGKWRDERIKNVCQRVPCDGRNPS